MTILQEILSLKLERPESVSMWRFSLTQWTSRRRNSQWSSPAPVAISSLQVVGVLSLPSLMTKVRNSGSVSREAQLGFLKPKSVCTEPSGKGKSYLSWPNIRKLGISLHEL